MRANGLRRALGRSDAFDLAQDARAAVRNRLLDQLLVAIERHLIRSSRRGEDRNDEANDRNGDDGADGHDQRRRVGSQRDRLATSAISRLRRRFTLPTLGGVLFTSTVGRKDCNSLAVMPRGRYRARCC